MSQAFPNDIKRDAARIQITGKGFSKLNMIDITFDFRTDSRCKDPDTYSPTLNAYHRALWSKKLPNGEMMELHSGRAPFVLTWKDFYFKSAQQEKHNSIFTSGRVWFSEGDHCLVSIESGEKLAKKKQVLLKKSMPSQRMH